MRVNILVLIQAYLVSTHRDGYCTVKKEMSHCPWFDRQWLHYRAV